MAITDKDFNFWIEHNLNVLFIGKHGVGKTTRIIEAFNRYNLKWKYFSAATIDPWVDFVGIPKEETDSSGHSYINFIRPREIEDDAVEAIFFDEFNRAPKKVLNSVMELIQFKSINGKKLNNLKIIWAAVNFNDDEEEIYSVEKIDPAQLDRFQVHVEIPYKLEKSYFSKKYDKGIATATIEWWNDLPAKIKDKVSPRRVEYALEVWKAGGDLGYILPKESNIMNLLSRLKTGPYELLLESIKTLDPNSDEVKNIFSDINFTTWILNNVADKSISNSLAVIIPNLSEEYISKLISENYKNSEIINLIYLHSKGQVIIDEIVWSGTMDKKIITQLKTVIKNNTKVDPNSGEFFESNKREFDQTAYQNVFNALDNTQRRQNAYETVWKDYCTTAKMINSDATVALSQVIVSDSQLNPMLAFARTMLVIKERSHSTSIGRPPYSGFNNRISAVKKFFNTHKGKFPIPFVKEMQSLLNNI